MTVKLMPIGKPTVNDRLYPLDVVLMMIEDAKPRIEERKLFIHLLPEPYADPTLNTVVGVVTRLFVADGFLQADFFYLDDKRLPDETEATISCVGVLDEKTRQVSDAKLSHLLAVEPSYRFGGLSADATIISRGTV